MQITIVAVGMRLPSWVNQGVNEYIKRFPPEVNVQLSEINPIKRNKSATREKILKQEADRIVIAIPKGSHIIVLDEHGKTQRTTVFAKNMDSWMREGKNISFIIGGADGIHEEIKKKANELWSLSDFTLPHGLARVLLTEQLYRAWTVIKKHPYHRE
jgi:23S rRNA (pseudouridine1915-N3)-methyltransferase